VGPNHIAWEIENEVALVDGYHRARARNAPVHRLADHQIAHSIYLADPDGSRRFTLSPHLDRIGPEIVATSARRD
jgi:hypothetical protein